MSLLFGRASRIVIDTIEIEFGIGAGVEPGSSLDVQFSIERSLKPEPNTAEIQIWNLNEDHRAQLEEPSAEGASVRVPVSVEAGYVDNFTTLYVGTMRTAFTTREGPSLITTLQSGDGEKEYQRSRVSLSLAKGTPNTSVLQQVVKALGITEGNLSSVSALLAAAPLLFPSGGVLSGSAAQIMTRITQSLGFEWSIQEGALQLLRVSAPLGATAVFLTPDTGLVGSPSIDNEGLLTAQSLLIPDIFPGRLLVLESERLSGNYRVEKCNYSGATHGVDWYIDIEARKL